MILAPWRPDGISAHISSPNSVFSASALTLATEVYIIRAPLSGSVAQSVEQRTFNPLVASSNLARPTTRIKQKSQPNPVGFFVFWSISGPPHVMHCLASSVRQSAPHSGDRKASLGLSTADRQQDSDGKTRKKQEMGPRGWGAVDNLCQNPQNPRKITCYCLSGPANMLSSAFARRAKY